MPTRACLEVTYAVPATAPVSPPMEPTLTIAPSPAARISGSTARVSRIGPVTLTAMTSSQVPSSTSDTGRK